MASGPAIAPWPLLSFYRGITDTSPTGAADNRDRRTARRLAIIPPRITLLRARRIVMARKKPSASDMHFVVERLNWRRDNGDKFHRYPGQARIASFDTREEAEAYRRERESKARAAVNPFLGTLAPPVEQTSLPEEVLCDWLTDQGIDPPKASKTGCAAVGDVVAQGQQDLERRPARRRLGPARPRRILSSRRAATPPGRLRRRPRHLGLQRRVVLSRRRGRRHADRLPLARESGEGRRPAERVGAGGVDGGVRGLRHGLRAGGGASVRAGGANTARPRPVRPGAAARRGRR